MQMGTFIHRVLELTHPTLLEALGDVAEVDLAIEPVLLQDVVGLGLSGST